MQIGRRLTQASTRRQGAHLFFIQVQWWRPVMPGVLRKGDKRKTMEIDERIISKAIVEQFYQKHRFSQSF